jgi:hypothetical protein
MDFRKFILSITFLVFTVFSSWGQTTQLKPYQGFLNYCKYAGDDQLIEINWLKYVLKADTCQGLADEISKLRSYNQFIVPLKKSKPFKVASWTNEFPEIYGLKSKYDIKDVEKILNVKINPEYFFTDIDPFNEFKNLKMIDFTFKKYTYSMCYVLYGLRYRVKTIIIDWSNFEELKNCKFYYDKPDVIITGDYIGDGKENFAENVIGIEHYILGTRHLKSYPNLRYVGLSLDHQFDRIGNLVLNQNITHLTINSTIPHEDLSDLSEMQNLAYLGLTCVKDEIKLYGKFDAVPVRCENPYLKNLDFLKNLTWLKSLNLSYSGLQNVDVLLEMDQLKSLDISNNNILKMPDFSLLKDLSKLKLDNNSGNEE